jgi:hypothetical protein
MRVRILIGETADPLSLDIVPPFSHLNLPCNCWPLRHATASLLAQRSLLASATWCAFSTVTGLWLDRAVCRGKAQSHKWRFAPCMEAAWHMAAPSVYDPPPPACSPPVRTGNMVDCMYHVVQHDWDDGRGSSRSEDLTFCEVAKAWGCVHDPL